jgi:hypothetical protein
MFNVDSAPSLQLNLEIASGEETVLSMKTQRCGRHPAFEMGAGRSGGQLDFHVRAESLSA